MSNWFVLFVKTGKEEIICDYLNNVLAEGGSVSFIPKIELIHKNSKRIYKELRPMFPSYVFIRTKKESRTFVNLISQIVRSSKHILKLLGREDPDYAALRKEEKDFLLKLCNNEYIVEKSLGFIEGDKVFMTSGPLRGRESFIKRIDRHKRRADIELEFMGDIRRISVSLDIVEKV